MGFLCNKENKECHQTHPFRCCAEVTLLLPVQVNGSDGDNCWEKEKSNRHKQSRFHDMMFSEMLSPSVCWLTGTVVGGTGLVLAVEQEGGTEDVSRLLFCSKSFFTVGRLQHGFSFGADKEKEKGMTIRSCMLFTCDGYRRSLKFGHELFSCWLIL